MPAQALGEVVSRIGAAVAEPLTSALQRVHEMASHGRIDRASLQTLRDEIASARRAGMQGQQIARLAAGQAQQRIERLPLARLLREVLTERAAEPGVHSALGHRQQLTEVDVLADASLMATLLRAAADWGLSLAQAPLQWRLDVLPWPVQARLSCVVVHGEEDRAEAVVAVDPQARLPQLDTLDWLLLQFAAHAADVPWQREDSASRSVLTLRFPGTVAPTVESSAEPDTGTAAPPARLVAGSQLLVLAARREARQRVREALQGQDLFIDHVPTVAEAVQYCDEGTPQVLLYESAFDSEALRRLCERLADAMPSCVLVELLPDASPAVADNNGAWPMLRVGSEALRGTLAPLLLGTLARRR